MLTEKISSAAPLSCTMDSRPSGSTARRIVVVPGSFSRPCAAAVLMARHQRAASVPAGRSPAMCSTYGSPRTSTTTRWVPW